MICRRSVLTALAVAIGWPVLARFAGRQGAGRQDSMRRAVAIFSEPATAAEMGRAYLGMRPEEANADWLFANLIAGAPGGQQTLEQLDDSALHTYLRERIRADFNAARTVWLDGWLLAQTESRLFALAALT
ncbi:MAG: hypothetical protein IPK66_12395 [Rhodospirillales bacterium]|nr:hypothetical protein [Rhodospirillales bacterium]